MGLVSALTSDTPERALKGKRAPVCGSFFVSHPPGAQPRSVRVAGTVLEPSHHVHITHHRTDYTAYVGFDYLWTWDPGVEPWVHPAMLRPAHTAKQSHGKPLSDPPPIAPWRTQPPPLLSTLLLFCDVCPSMVVVAFVCAAARVALLTNLKHSVGGVITLVAEGCAAPGAGSPDVTSPSTSAVVVGDDDARKLLRCIEDCLFFGLKVGGEG